MAPRSRRDSKVAGYASREMWAGHDADFRERAELFADIDDEINRREMFRHDAHRVAGIPNGSLEGSTLSTDLLRQVLEILQALPEDPGAGPFRFALQAVPGPGWDAPNLAALLGGPSPGG